MSLRNDISKGNIKKAISSFLNLVEGKDEDLHSQLILLSSSFSSLSKSCRLGTISLSDESVTRAKIVSALLNLVSLYEGDSVELNVISEDSNSDILNKVIRKYKRLNPNVSNQAKDLKNKIRKYEDKKSLGNYDPSGRKWQIIQNQINKLSSLLTEVKGNSVEDLNDKVNALLKDWNNWDSINEAYVLLSGRGFSDNWIKEQLSNRPNDDEVKDNVCERLENYLSKALS